MFSLLKALLMIVTLILSFETFEGEIDPPAYKLAPKTSQFSNCEFNEKVDLHYSSSIILEQNRNCSNSSDCPTWFVCNKTQPRQALSECQCGPRYNDAIKCSEKTMVSAVMNCYCVTEVGGITYAGLCFYNCARKRTEDTYPSIYHVISDKKDLNDFMCGHFNRTGILCGKCKPGLSPFVLSYNLSCVECRDGHKNWWKFVLIGFVPLTFLYFIAIFFNINVTSSRLHGYVLFSQALSTPAFVRVLFNAVEDIPSLLKASKTLLPFLSLWNLDPFRSLLPDVCMNIDTLTAFALEACVAVYPMVLMIVSYMLIELYDRNVRCIVVIWKPFHKIFQLFRDNWDIRTSVIDSFATFFLLSYVKILSVSTDLMVFTAVHELQNKSHYRLYYDANVEFFRGNHIPYALLSASLAIFFIIVPTLILILYPFRWFQKCLSYYQIQWHFLHAFVDSFQGCYKDGTEPGTHDLRCLSAYGLMLRLGVCIIFTLTLTTMYFIYALLLFIVILILLVNFQPYKSSVSHYATIDITFLILLSLTYTSILGNHIALAKGQRHLYFIIYALGVSSCFTPIIYIIFIMLQWMYLKRKWSGRILMRAKRLLN